MPLRINRKLNLVIPVEIEPGKTIYVHSTPISREVFENYYIVISRTFSKIWGLGLSHLSGPSAAAIALKKTAEEIDEWEGEAGVKNGLLPEIRRLTNVVMPVDGRGWDTIPFEDIISKSLLHEDDLWEVEGMITFFILASCIMRKETLNDTLDGMSSLWDVQTTLSNCTEYANSLPTLTETDNSGATDTGAKPISSVPS